LRGVARALAARGIATLQLLHLRTISGCSGSCHRWSGTVPHSRSQASRVQLPAGMLGSGNERGSKGGD
jgi:hypothetical protein